MGLIAICVKVDSIKMNHLKPAMLVINLVQNVQENSLINALLVRQNRPSKKTHNV